MDPFGNLITTIPGALLAAWPPGRAAAVEAGPVGPPLRAAIARTYGGLAPGDAGVLVGSDDLVEVAVNGGSAAARTDAVPGSPIRIRVLRGR